MSTLDWFENSYVIYFGCWTEHYIHVLIEVFLFESNTFPPVVPNLHLVEWQGRDFEAKAAFSTTTWCRSGYSGLLRIFVHRPVLKDSTSTSTSTALSSKKSSKGKHCASKEFWAQYGPTSMRAGCNAIEKDAPGASLFNCHIFQMAIGHQRQMEKLSPR